MNPQETGMQSSEAVMLFDGDCGFCRRWIKKWAGTTGTKVRYEPYQEALARFPEVTEEQCRRSVQLILRDRSVFSGAHAVFKALALGGRSRLLGLYERLPLFRRLSEGAYRLVARNRVFFSKWI